MLAECIIGLHIASYHFKGDYNNFNPGMYVVCDSYTAGGYLNSNSKTSLYVGKRYEYAGLKFTIGLVTGYPKPIVPLFGISKEIYKGYNITFVPSTKLGPALLHLTKEFN